MKPPDLLIESAEGEGSGAPRGSGRLTLVPTPLGNLEDITLRALRVLGEADRIVAEDTRHTGRLLAHYEIKSRLFSFHEHNEARQLPRLLEHLTRGEHLALVSNAGTPAVSDPGFRAVRAALEAGHVVEALPGASAFLTALVASGLPCDRFVFEGYLPRKAGARRRALAALDQEPRTVVFYESPHRLAASLSLLGELDPERPVVVARELSKRHEEFWRGAAGDMAAALKGRRIRGELVLLVGPRGAALPQTRLP